MGMPPANAAAPAVAPVGLDSGSAPAPGMEGMPRRGGRLLRLVESADSDAAPDRESCLLDVLRPSRLLLMAAEPCSEAGGRGVGLPVGNTMLLLRGGGEAAKALRPAGLSSAVNLA